MVDVDPMDVRLALVPFQPVHVVLDRFVDVDRTLVDEHLGAEQVDLAEDARAVGRGVDDDDVLRRGRAERDLRGREVLARPVPASVACLADVAGFGEEREQVVGRARPEDLARLERQLERRRAQMGEQDVQVVGVEPGLLGRSLEQELRVVDDVLVDRRSRGDQDRDARPVAATRPAELLPRPGDRARVARQDRHVEPADVHAELERVGRHHAEDLAVAQAAFDRPPLGRQVAAAVAADPAARAVALAQRLAQAGQQDLDRHARAAEDDGLAPGPQERQRPALGEGQRGAPGAALRVEDRRVDEDDVALAGRSAVPVHQPYRPADEHLGQLGRVPDGRRAADDDRMAAVVGADAEQPAEDVGDVAAEHAAIGVQLVDHDVAELLEQLEPLGVMRQDRRVEHVRVGHHDLPGGSDRRPDRRRRVAVVGRGRDRQTGGGRQLAELGDLVLAERLGREQQQRPRRGVVGDGLHDRQRIAQASCPTRSG